MSYRWFIIFSLFLITAGCSDPMPLSIDAMRTDRHTATFTFERALEDGPGFSAYLVSYRSSGLKVYAMVAVPNTRKPEAGYPVLVANHGFVPTPGKYGISADGIDSRPGDYYRDIPDIYTREGFLVVMPDYRGHNTSEGFEFTTGFLATNYYTQDVLALLSALPDLDDADLDSVFMWGHSLGGEITLRTLLVDGSIRGASLWSPVGGSLWEQAYHYSWYDSDDDTDSHDKPKARMDELSSDIDSLSFPYDPDSSEPGQFLHFLNTPIVVHHAKDDGEVPYIWSELLATNLELQNKTYTFYSYESDKHLFKDELQAIAVARDVEFFRSLLRETTD